MPPKKHGEATGRTVLVFVSRNGELTKGVGGRYGIKLRVPAAGPQAMPSVLQQVTKGCKLPLPVRPWLHKQRAAPRISATDQYAVGW